MDRLHIQEVHKGKADDKANDSSKITTSFKPLHVHENTASINKGYSLLSWNMPTKK